MEYVIEYEGLIDDLVKNKETKVVFDKVKECSNKNKLELTEEEFRAFFSLCKSGKDVNWIMNNMSTYKTSLIDALISYISY